MKNFQKLVVLLVLVSMLTSPLGSLNVTAAFNYSEPVTKDTIVGSTLSVNNPDTVLYVSPGGSLDSDGSEGAPFGDLQTAIDQAIVQINSGSSTRILVKEGVYSLDSMIGIYNLSPDADDFLHILGEGNVKVTGSKVWTDWDKEPDNSIYSKEWNYRWGMVNNTYEGRIPEPLQYREVAFVNQIPMLPVRAYEDLKPGTMFVSEAEGRIFICPPEDIDDLNTELVEVSESGGFINSSGMDMGNLLEVINVNNLKLENLNFEKAAAGVSDAVVIRHGQNITIESCTFNSSAYGGLRFDDIENGLINNCEANGNGGKGIAISNGKNIIVSNSSTDGNNWFGYPYGWIQWDPAGMKIFRGHEMRIINHSSSQNYCEGIWADTDIINMFIENPTIIGNKNHGLWIEANVGPVYVENGRIEDNKNYGLYNSSTENLYLDGLVFRSNKGEIAIGDFNTKGRGPLVSDPVWAGDYGNTFGNFETGEGFVSHAVDMTIENCTFIGADLSETPLFIYVKSDDKDSYKPWMDTLTANNNTYSHYNPDKAFYIASSANEGTFGNLSAWQAATSQDSDSVFSNEGVSYSEEQPPSGVTSNDVEPKPGQRVVQASYTESAPVIDGVKDEVWTTTTSIVSDYEFENQDKDSGIDNAVGVASLLWDEEYLYFIVTVDDDNPTRGTDSNWQCDNVEVFLDQNFEQTSSYEADDGQYRIGHDGERSGKTLTWDLSALEEYAAVINDDNYVVEGKIKVNYVSMIEGRVMGFDYQVADEREVAGVYGRRGIQMWNDKTANGYNSTANWGYLELVDTAVDVAPIPEPLFVETIQTDIPAVLEIGSEHDISLNAFMSDGQELTPEEIQAGEIVYGSADQSVLSIDASGHMTGLSSGKTMVSVRFNYQGSTKTLVKQVVVPGTLSAFDYQDISPQSDKVHEYSGKITFYPYGCEWMTSGTELVFYGVDFGEEDSEQPYLNYQIQGHAIGEEMAGGKIEFRIDSPDNPAFGSLVIEDTSAKLDENVDDWNYNNSRLMQATMSQNITGKHTLYMRFVGEPGNETHANLRMGKFYWANFFRSDTPIIQEVTEKIMVDLFTLDFEDDAISTYGSYDINVDEAKVGLIQINSSGSEGDIVELRDGSLYFEKDNGPLENSYGQIQLAIKDIEVPDTDILAVGFDINALNWTMEDKWQDFPKIVFEKEDGSLDYGVLIMENANGIGGNFAPGAWNQVNYKDEANLNRFISFRYEFNMNTGSYKVFKDDVEWISNGQIHTGGSEFIPEALDSFIFKIQRAAGDESQKLLMDNIKVSYLKEVVADPGYMLSVIKGSGGAQYQEGQEVVIEANPAEDGYQFKEWLVRQGSLLIDTPQNPILSFIMPGQHTSIEAVYEDVLVDEVNQVSMTTLFDLDFTNQVIDGFGRYMISETNDLIVGLDESQSVASLLLEGPESGLVNNGDSQDALVLDGPGIRMKLSDFKIPETNYIKMTYDLTVEEGYDGSQDSYNDFPKVEFLTLDDQVKFGSLMLQKHNELLLMSLNPDKTGTNYETFKMDDKVQTKIPVVYEFNMTEGSYRLSMNGHQFGYGVDDIWMAENNSGTDFLPKALEAFTFKTGAGSDESNQKLLFDNIKVEFEDLKWSLYIEGGHEAGYYNQGELVTLTPEPAEKGKEFSHWEVIYGSLILDDPAVAVQTIAMPGKAVGIKAVYLDKGNNGNGKGQGNTDQYNHGVDLKELEQEVEEKLDTLTVHLEEEEGRVLISQESISESLRLLETFKKEMTASYSEELTNEALEDIYLPLMIDHGSDPTIKATMDETVIEALKENNISGLVIGDDTFSASFGIEDLEDIRGQVTFTKEEINPESIDLSAIKTDKKDVKVFSFELSVEDDLGVSQITSFQKPVEIKLDPSYFEGINNRNKAIFGYVGADGEFEQMKFKKNSDGTYSAYLNHFSHYALFESSLVMNDMETHWAKSYGEVLVARNVVILDDEMNFNPDHLLTRAEIADYLVKALFFEVQEGDKLSFEDVDLDSPYYESIALLNRLGIINGYSSEVFKPNQTVSREEAVVIMMKSYLYLTGEMVEENTLKQFVDEEKISQWARSSIAQGVELGLIQGYASKEIKPGSSISKAEGAKLITKILELLSYI